MKKKSENTYKELLKKEKNPGRRKVLLIFSKIYEDHEKHGSQSKLTSVQLLRKYSR